jgi:hypothetical protein
MASEFQKKAALNNAAWCVAMWSAHGLAVERQHGIAACLGAPPRFYPNAVTLDPEADPATQRAKLNELAALAGVGPNFTVKDSFQALDLGEHGYKRLFDAVWIRRDGRVPARPPMLDWRIVERAEELQVWDQAWSRGETPVGSIFKPDLLSGRGVGVLGGWAGDRLVAGCVLAPTGDVVGLSNVFGAYDEVVSAVAAGFRGRDIVGYERDASLEAAMAAGFEAVGDLSVWIR